MKMYLEMEEVPHHLCWALFWSFHTSQVAAEKTKSKGTIKQVGLAWGGGCRNSLNLGVRIEIVTYCDLIKGEGGRRWSH
jgi:hypothetical protein